jgi:pyruvate kinase
MSPVGSEIDVRVDIGVLKTQVSAITELCQKMDKVIEKIVDTHDRHLVKVYEDMEKRRSDTEKDINDIHDRIDTVLDKVQITELRLMEELKQLRKEIAEHNRGERQSLDQILQWKWMLAGGIIVLSWLISHVKFDTITRLLN